MERDGDGRGTTDVSGEVYEVRFEGCDGPGEEQDHGGGASGDGGSGNGDYLFEVVLWDCE